MASVQTSSHEGRYLKLTVVEESYSIANNTSTIRWTIESIGGSSTYYSIYNYKVVVNGVTRDGDGSLVGWSTYKFPAKKGSKTGTFTVTHNSDGTASDVSFELHGKVFVNGDENKKGKISLTTIPRASSVSGGTGNIGSNTAINISRKNNNFTHILKYSFGNLSGTIATGVATSYTWTIPTSFYTQIPQANSGTGTITCETYSGNTLIGKSSCQFTAKVIDSNPIFDMDDVSYEDTNTTITAITENNQHIVRNLSNLKVTVSSAIAKNSASISKYEITFNNVTKTLTTAGTVDFGTINLSSNANLSVKVIDSRGNVTSVSKEITIFDWELPIAIITAERLNNYEDETDLKVDVTISSVNSKNSIQSLKYRYKKSSETDYSNYNDIPNNEKIVVSIDKLYVWDFQVQIKDKFGTKTYNFQVPKGMPILMIDTNLIAVGINCFPKNNNSFCVNGSDFLEYEIIEEWEE